jgi:hypothetical protein
VRRRRSGGERTTAARSPPEPTSRLTHVAGDRLSRRRHQSSDQCITPEKSLLITAMDLCTISPPLVCPIDATRSALRLGRPI